MIAGCNPECSSQKINKPNFEPTLQGKPKHLGWDKELRLKPTLGIIRLVPHNSGTYHDTRSILGSTKANLR